MSKLQKLPARHSKWLQTKSLTTVFDAIEAAGGKVRVNGGAVRNTLMGLAVGDIDLSTTLEPEATVAALVAADIRAVPTGFEHGTITAVSDSTPYEITTLRQDIETHGRHATVSFGTDWQADAMRRDFTMNALYADRHGALFDPIGGLDDLRNRNMRFIGDAEERIREDYLRILRFFRFFAWYGDGRPDAEGLKACGRLKDGLAQISVERIWMETKKMLAAPDPGRALLWMRTAGVLRVILPESERWGIDLIPALVDTGKRHRWPPDPLVRLEAMIRPDGEVVTGLARRLKLSQRENGRLAGWAAAQLPDTIASEKELAQALYLGDRLAIADRFRLELARLEGVGVGDAEVMEQAEAVLAQLRFAMKWKRPVFPLKGKDLLKAGAKTGPEMGKKLKALEQAWIEADFRLDRAQLLAMAAEA